MRAPPSRGGRPATAAAVGAHAGRARAARQPARGIAWKRTDRQSRRRRAHAAHRPHALRAARLRSRPDDAGAAARGPAHRRHPLRAPRGATGAQPCRNSSSCSPARARSTPAWGAGCTPRAASSGTRSTSACAALAARHRLRPARARCSRADAGAGANRVTQPAHLLPRVRARPHLAAAAACSRLR